MSDLFCSMNALKWTLALLLLCVALAPLIDASTEDEEVSEYKL